MSPAELAQRLAALDWSATSLQHQLAIAAACVTLKGFESMPAPAPSNVIQIPVRPRACWTTLCHLDGREWATSSHFGPDGAWGWIVEAVAHEHGCNEDDVHALEGSEDQYNGDDLVTIDGLPVYRIQHLSI